jgi:hypothetical protein
MRLIGILLSLALCAGCHTMQTVDHTDWSTLSRRVEPGDLVEVRTHDGLIRRFEATEVRNNGIAGPGIDIAMADIASLQVHAVSKGRATAVTLGSVAAGYLVLSAIAAVLVLGAL